MPKHGAIRASLIKLSGLTQKRDESDHDYLTRVHLKVADANLTTEEEWASLSEAAQDWNNAAADALDAKQPLPKFSDESEEEEKPAATGRRRGAAAAAEKVEAYVPKVGDKVLIETKRGKKDEGTIVELAEGVVVINKDGEDGKKEDDVEYTVANVTITNAKAEAKADPVEQVDKEPPNAGDTVQVLTARDKTIMGVVLEINIDGDLLVIKDPAGAEHELSINRLKNCVVKTRGNVKAKPAPAPAPAETGRRRGAAAPAPAPAAAGGDDDEGGKPGVGSMIRNMLVDNPDATLEQCEAALKKAGVEFRPVTSKTVYKATKQTVDAVLKKHGK